MADLDDFFAKKDRKKAKGKKFTTTDEIAKKLEETGRRNEKIKKDKSLISQSNTGQDGDDLENQHPDDEWKDFEEEKKDYTGLKIGNLQITENDGDSGEGDEEEEQIMEENEAGEMILKRKTTGPWKLIQQPQQQQQQQQQQPPPEEAPPVEKRPETQSNSYVVPHLRNQSKQSHPSPRNRKTAPDISSEEYFPTLAAAKNIEPSGAWGRRKRDEGSFEEVRNSKSHSSRYETNSKLAATGAGPKLSLGNKYDALSQDQS